jgi:hypothetical protein
LVFLQIFFDHVKDTMQSVSDITLGDGEEVSKLGLIPFRDLKNTGEL